MKQIFTFFVGGCLLSLSMFGCQMAPKPTDPAILQVKADSAYTLKSKMVSDSFNAAKSGRVNILTDSIVKAHETATK